MVPLRRVALPVLLALLAVSPLAAAASTDAAGETPLPQGGSCGLFTIHWDQPTNPVEADPDGCVWALIRSVIEV